MANTRISVRNAAAVIVAVVAALAGLAYFQHSSQFPRETEQLLDEYDFVIVGGGSAGSVLANRLTENANWTVLLLEAGGHENIMSDIPVMLALLQKGNLDWSYLTEPQETACLAMVDNKCSWPRGKVTFQVCRCLLWSRDDGWRGEYDSIVPLHGAGIEN